MSRAGVSRALTLLLLVSALAFGVEGMLPVRSARARSKPVAETKVASSESAGTDRADDEAALAPLAPNANVGNDTDSKTDREERAALRVLLVGNSYTLHHNLQQMLQRVANSVSGGPRVTVEQAARGGYSLRNHLRTGDALQRIRAGHYTHVVLQGHSLSAVDHPNELVADAERFKAAIDAVAGRTVLYATWARSPEVSLYRTHKVVHSFAEMSTRVSSTYGDLSSRLGAALAPVGSAFERSLVEHPKLTLWGSDGSHPSLAGTYTAACVLYGAITGTDPLLITYAPPGLKPADAEVVRSVAAESLAASKADRALSETTSTAELEHNGPI